MTSLRLLWLLPVLLAPVQDDAIAVGRENWEKPWVPDLARPEKKVAIPVERRIDVVIFPEGYLAGERAAFEKDVQSWYDGFLKLTPWSQLRGAFRVRGFWRPSEARANSDRKSRFAVPVDAKGVGNVNTKETRESVFAELAKVDLNAAGGRSYSHAVVVLLLKDDRGRNPSGLTRRLTSPDNKRSIAVAFAAYTHHEFGHAYGGLRDEYIDKAGEKSRLSQPARIDLWSVSNLTFTRDLKLLPWSHLAPGSAVNPDKDSLVGACWIGGGTEEGAWHCEARCLMNGRHENWDLAKTKRGVDLRDRERFCFWCEELLVARTLARTGQLGDSDDGPTLWKKWEALRPAYHKALDVAGRIRERNEANAKSGLAEAKIFERPLP